MIVNIGMEHLRAIFVSRIGVPERVLRVKSITSRFLRHSHSKVTRYSRVARYLSIFTNRKRAGTGVASINITLYQ